MSAHRTTGKRDTVTGVTCHTVTSVTLHSRKRAHLGAAQRDNVTFSRELSHCHAPKWRVLPLEGRPGVHRAPVKSSAWNFRIQLRVPNYRNGGGFR